MCIQQPVEESDICNIIYIYPVYSNNNIHRDSTYCGTAKLYERLPLSVKCIVHDRQANIIKETYSIISGICPIRNLIHAVSSFFSVSPAAVGWVPLWSAYAYAANRSSVLFDLGCPAGRE